MKQSIGWDTVLSFVIGLVFFVGLSYSGILDKANSSLSQPTGIYGYAVVMVGAIVLMGLVEVMQMSGGARIAFTIGAGVGGALAKNVAAVLIGFGGFTLTFLIELIRWQQRKIMEAYQRGRK